MHFIYHTNISLDLLNLMFFEPSLGEISTVLFSWDLLILVFSCPKVNIMHNSIKLLQVIPKQAWLKPSHEKLTLYGFRKAQMFKFA